MSLRQLKPVYASADPSHRYNGVGVPVITSVSAERVERPVHLRCIVTAEPRRLVLIDLTEGEARKVAADIVSLLGARVGGAQ